MEFRAIRKNGYSMVAKSDEKKVIIRKTHKGLLDVIEFPINERMTEIMGENYYSLKGELVTEYSYPITFKEAVADYNYYEVECKA